METPTCPVCTGTALHRRVDGFDCLAVIDGQRCTGQYRYPPPPSPDIADTGTTSVDEVVQIGDLQRRVAAVVADFVQRTANLDAPGITIGLRKRPVRPKPTRMERITNAQKAAEKQRLHELPPYEPTRVPGHYLYEQRETGSGDNPTWAITRLYLVLPSTLAVSVSLGRVAGPVVRWHDPDRHETLQPLEGLNPPPGFEPFDDYGVLRVAKPSQPAAALPFFARGEHVHAGANQTVAEFEASVDWLERRLAAYELELRTGT